MQPYDISWLKKMPIAHRGLHDTGLKIPENSIRAFENAIKHNYAIELDVYVISDLEVIVFHDDTLTRMCGINKNVFSLTSFNYNVYKLNKTEERIPLLKDVLRLVNGKVPIIIEIKSQPGIKRTNVMILNTLLGYRGFVAIQSFNPFIVAWFARNAPSLIRGQLSSNFKDEEMNRIKKYLLKKCAFNFISRPHFLAYDVRDLPNRFIAKKRRKGMLVVGWTVTNDNNYKQIAPYCDNIIFETFIPG